MPDELAPKKQRPACPFYGFYPGPGVLVDQKGNQCACITDSYSPCQMEREGQMPDWEECKYVSKTGRMEEILAKFEVFPEEFREGISLPKWMRYVRSQHLH